MKEYGRKPYLCKSYHEMMNKTSNISMWNQIKQKHSEFEKPYFHRAGEYAEMQHYFPNLPGLSGIPSFSLSGVKFDDMRFDHPWMGRPVDDVKKMGLIFHLFPGCGFVFPGLFATIARCETKCEVLDDRYKWASGEPQDPIVSWEAINGVITESDMFHACIKADAEAPHGQFVELIATTKSGATCEGFAWVEGDDCISCDCTDITIGYTTQQMAVDEVQTLTATNGTVDCTYDWAIDSGGGSLSAATGLSVDYTAPSSNAECAENPVISLKCEGETCDTLQIAINAVVGSNNLAYTIDCVTQYNQYMIDNDFWACCKEHWSCDASYYPSKDSCSSTYCCEAIGNCYSDSGFNSYTRDYEYSLAAALAKCNDHMSGIGDLRTESLITQGCCPSALL